MLSVEKDQLSSNHIVFLKPISFMNILGRNVKDALKHFNGIEFKKKGNLIVIHDDLE